MSSSKLPERPSLEYLKKLAKERLTDLRKSDSAAKLATAHLLVARDHGFSNWRALKAGIEDGQPATPALFFEACAKGETAVVTQLLEGDPELARLRQTDGPWPNSTALHLAALAGHLDVAKLLLDGGADPNAREAGDNASPLHLATIHGHLAVMRALLDAGSDVHGSGDVHETEVIGWATSLLPPDAICLKCVDLLLASGAQHHIFSAIALGDMKVIRELVAGNRASLDRRMSPFEQRQSPLHFALSRKQYDIATLLVELGADLHAEDINGNTPLAMAILSGDQEAIRLLKKAGAEVPKGLSSATYHAEIKKLAAHVRKGVPMISVPDIAETLKWYVSLGFKEVTRFEEDGVANFGMLSFGNAELMLRLEPWGPEGRHQQAGKPGPHDVSLWFYTDQVDRIYQLLRSRQFAASKDSAASSIEFVEDIYDTFYGARQFSIRDLNGFTLVFISIE
jgi:ankyrin repeat protein/catechol 2,3-dioxygenase-like lactoylglutathione lyase family enzyme